jgi:hypothetical protein
MSSLGAAFAPVNRTLAEQTVRATTPLPLEELSTALSAAPSLNSLGEQERWLFSSRVAAFFSVWNQTTVDEYDDLMRSWGGVLRVDENHETFREMRERDWSAIGGECSIRSLDAGLLSVDLIPALETDGMTATQWPVHDDEGMGSIHYTIFRFGEGQDRMAREAAQVIQLEVPAETHDGSRINLSMRWIRIPGSVGWVPWMIHQTVPRGDGVCVFYF